MLRLKHLLGVLDRHPEHRARVAALLRRFWSEVDSAALLADFGFAPRMDLWGELGRRLRVRLLPLTPATTDLGELFALLFPRADDAAWLLTLDDATLERLRTYVVPDPQQASPQIDWRAAVPRRDRVPRSAVRAAGFSPALRQRMSPELLADQPFRQLARVAEQVCEARRRPGRARRRGAAAAGAVPARAARRLPALRRQRAPSTSRRTASRSTWCSRSTSCARARAASTRC